VEGKHTSKGLYASGAEGINRADGILSANEQIINFFSYIWLTVLAEGNFSSPPIWLQRHYGKVIIDFKFQNVTNFEKGRPKVEITHLSGAIDKTGKIIEPATNKYTIITPSHLYTLTLLSP
jgi:hypothetical protein